MNAIVAISVLTVVFFEGVSMRKIWIVFLVSVLGLQGCSYLGWSNSGTSAPEEEEAKTDPDDRLYH